MRTGREGEDNKRHVEVCHGVESQGAKHIPEAVDVKEIQHWHKKEERDMG